MTATRYSGSLSSDGDILTVPVGKIAKIIGAGRVYIYAGNAAMDSGAIEVNGFEIGSLRGANGDIYNQIEGTIMIEGDVLSFDEYSGASVSYNFIVVYEDI